MFRRTTIAELVTTGEVETIALECFFAQKTDKQMRFNDKRHCR